MRISKRFIFSSQFFFLLAFIRQLTGCKWIGSIYTHLTQIICINFYSINIIAAASHFHSIQLYLFTIHIHWWYCFKSVWTYFFFKFTKLTCFFFHLCMFPIVFLCRTKGMRRKYFLQIEWITLRLQSKWIYLLFTKPISLNVQKC